MRIQAAQVYVQCPGLCPRVHVHVNKIQVKASKFKYDMLSNLECFSIQTYEHSRFIIRILWSSSSHLKKTFKTIAEIESSWGSIIKILSSSITSSLAFEINWDESLPNHIRGKRGIQTKHGLRLNQEHKRKLTGFEFGTVILWLINKYQIFFTLLHFNPLFLFLLMFTIYVTLDRELKNESEEFLSLIHLLFFFFCDFCFFMRERESHVSEFVVMWVFSLWFVKCVARHEWVKWMSIYRVLILPIRLEMHTKFH